VDSNQHSEDQHYELFQPVTKFMVEEKQFKKKTKKKCKERYLTKDIVNKGSCGYEYFKIV